MDTTQALQSEYVDFFPRGTNLTFLDPDLGALSS
jgi:hypothetical protein